MLATIVQKHFSRRVFNILGEINFENASGTVTEPNSDVVWDGDEIAANNIWKKRNTSRRNCLKSTLRSVNDSLREKKKL